MILNSESVLSDKLLILAVLILREFDCNYYVTNFVINEVWTIQICDINYYKSCAGILKSGAIFHEKKVHEI